MKKSICAALLSLLSLALFFVCASADETAEPVESYGEAVLYVRQALVGRQERARFRYTGEDFGAPKTEDILAYTENGAEGDYLRLSFRGGFPETARDEDGVYTVTASYFTTAEQEAEVAARASELLTGLTGETPEEKALWIYQTLCDTVAFDLENLYDETVLSKYTAWGALVEGKAVCQGFAQLYYRLAREAGISCRIVAGNRDGEPHAWNIVESGGVWYHVDASSGAQLFDPSPYFMQECFLGYYIVYHNMTAPEIMGYPFEEDVLTGMAGPSSLWKFRISDRSLTISGSGEVDIGWERLRNLFSGDDIRTLTFAEGITGITGENQMFLSTFGTVYIPASFVSFDERILELRTEPGPEAFVVSPDNPVFTTDGKNLIRTAGKEIVWGNREISIPADGSVTRIGRWAFQAAELPSGELVIPECITSIGKCAFRFCDGIASVRLLAALSDRREDDVNGFEYCRGLKSVTVGGACRRIPPFMFFCCEGLTEVALGENVTEIGEQAFAYCDKLKTIALPDGLTDLGERAFIECHALIRLDLPAGIVRVPELLCEGCESLESVTFSPRSDSVGRNSFRRCVSLTSVSLPAGLKTVEPGAFSGCEGLKEIFLPDSVAELGERAFENCGSVTRITLPAGLTVVAAALFSGCRSLETVTLPAGLERIENGAFYRCGSLTEIYIPKTVSYIAPGPFERCAALRRIVVDPGCEAYRSDENGVLYACGQLERIVRYPSALPGSVWRMPEKGVEIGKRAFEGAVNLEEVYLSSDGDDRYCPLLGEGAFLDCEKLRTVGFPVGATAFRIPSDCFMRCVSLERVDLPETLAEIAYAAFYGCQSLNSVNIPEGCGLQKIDSWAFSSCVSLEQIVLPAALQEIESYAFCHCDALKTVYIPRNTTRISNAAFDSIPAGQLTLLGGAGSYAAAFAASHGLRFSAVCSVTKNEHAPRTEAAAAATCLLPAYAEGVRCTLCGEWLSGHEELSPAFGHAPASPVRINETPASCSVEGGYDAVIVCTRCGETLSVVHEKTEALPHADVDRNGYCDDCGAYICLHEETALRNKREVTCTENGYSGDTVCLICGAVVSYGETAYAPGHTSTLTAAVPATCLAPGKTAGAVCSVCGEVLLPAGILPVSGHTDADGDGYCELCFAPTGCGVYGEVGDGVYWYLDRSVLWLTGAGEALVTGDAPWEAHRGGFDCVYVKEGVTGFSGVPFAGKGDAPLAVFAPEGSALPDAPEAIFYVWNGQTALLSRSEAPAFDVYGLLNAAYVFSSDRTLSALRFDTLRLLGADGGDYVEYDVLTGGKLASETHYRLPSGAPLGDLTFSPYGYPSFNAAHASLGDRPERNLILSVECDDLLPADLSQGDMRYTEQIVVHFVEDPVSPAEPPEEEKNFVARFVDRVQATLAMILALFKRLFKLFQK